MSDLSGFDDLVVICVMSFREVCVLGNCVEFVELNEMCVRIVLNTVYEHHRVRRLYNFFFQFIHGYINRHPTEQNGRRKHFSHSITINTVIKPH